MAAGPVTLFMIEYTTDWCDQGEWMEYEGDSDDRLVFTSEDAAQRYIDAILDADYAKAKAAYANEVEKAEPKRELFNQRKSTLEAAGLWKQDGESFVPLIGYSWPGPAPSRGGDKWRVVPARLSVKS